MSVFGNASARVERAPSSNLIVRWWTRRRAQRRAYRHEVAYAVLDLHERYGASAREIALNSSRQPLGFEWRRFWRRVARDLKRARL
jgi:hypothetical protein